MAGANPTKGRVKNDFYPTEPEATQALINHEGAGLPQQIWEPACGNGAMSKVLIASGRTVFSSDLIDRGYGDRFVNFLLTDNAVFPAICTNPPFELAEEFIRHAHKLRVRYLALILKAQYWHADCRAGLFALFPPSRIYALTWRLDFLGLGAPTMDRIWCVWDDSPDKTRYLLMRKPTEPKAAADLFG